MPGATCELRGLQVWRKCRLKNFLNSPLRSWSRRGILLNSRLRKARQLVSLGQCLRVPVGNEFSKILKKVVDSQQETL